MGSLNKVMLIGRLGKDPEIRYTQSGSAVANFSLATSENWTDKQGQKQEKTEWHDIVAWDRLADLAQNYLKKGAQIYVEGRLQTRSWEDQNGQKRYKTEVVANTIQFLESRQGDAAQASAGGYSQNAGPANYSGGGGGGYQQSSPPPQGGGYSYEPRPAHPAPTPPRGGRPEQAPPPPQNDSYIEDDIPF